MKMTTSVSRSAILAIVLAGFVGFAQPINMAIALDQQSDALKKEVTGGKPDSNNHGDETTAQTKYFGVALGNYFLCYVGAFVLFFKLHKDDNPTLTILATIQPAWKDKPPFRALEALLFAFFGALISGVITQPENPQQAIAAGLGWTGLLSKTK